MLIWIQTEFDGISNAVAMLGAGMILSRFISMFALKKAGLYERLGQPRLLFFSDLLPLKLLCLKAPRVGKIARIVFATYAATYVGFLGAMVLMIISLSLR